jgi:hypothetical protein
VKIEERRDASPPSMEEMRPKIVQWLMFEEQRRIVEKLKANSRIARITEQPGGFSAKRELPQPEAAPDAQPAPPPAPPPTATAPAPAVAITPPAKKPPSGAIAAAPPSPAVQPPITFSPPASPAAPALTSTSPPGGREL